MQILSAICIISVYGIDRNESPENCFMGWLFEFRSPKGNNMLPPTLRASVPNFVPIGLPVCISIANKQTHKQTFHFIY